ncbi:MAG TPA: hypothetical protein VLA61_06165 [Ideonella sp.]|uniref:hypothetical protein n=1 Tax=Ideonella sp. TaxID=1929293 RepID=UPI002CB93515|nr:hypothetical protein [Ideonella sp.]HSI47833.1 hypothetical protein [Ideonella sp.]
MSAITSQTFNHGPALNIPRGAQLGADLFFAAGRLLSRLIKGDARPAAQMSRLAEADQVRELARHWERTDPGFAADLRAAAARHESDVHFSA